MSLKRAAVVWAASVVCLLNGCDETDGSSTETTETTENVRASDPDLADVTLSDKEAEEFDVFDFSELVEPYDTSEECIAHLETEIGDTSPLSACRCNECLDLMQECDALQGCVEIRSCAQNTGCSNEYDCYLLPTATCTDVIDEWGNASVATATAVALLDCSVQNDCN